MPHIGHGAHRIVGHRVDDQGNATRPIALVAQLLHVVCAVGTRTAPDGAFDGVLGHVRGERFFDADTQARIGRWIAAIASSNGDLADQLGKDLAALGILGVLAIFDTGASAHGTTCAFKC